MAFIYENKYNASTLVLYDVSCMPMCQFNVLNMHLLWFICYYWSLEFFKSTFYSYYLFGFETYRLIGLQLSGR